MEDKELLEKFLNPETKHYAFNMLVKKYQQKVYWLIRKMVIDHDDADDLTQEVFIKVWNALESFKGNSQLYTWLYRIATNECLNFLNRKKRKFFLPIYDVEKELSSKLDGRFTETKPDGRVFEIGRVTSWQPGARLALTWRQESFAVDQLTRVEVRFEPVGDETRVTVEHLGWDSVPTDHVARHRFPDAIFLRRHGEWWQALLASLRHRLAEGPD